MVFINYLFALQNTLIYFQNFLFNHDIYYHLFIIFEVHKNSIQIVYKVLHIELMLFIFLRVIFLEYLNKVIPIYL